MTQRGKVYNERFQQNYQDALGNVNTALSGAIGEVMGLIPDGGCAFSGMIRTIIFK